MINLKQTYELELDKAISPYDVMRWLERGKGQKYNIKRVLLVKTEELNMKNIEELAYDNVIQLMKDLSKKCKEDVSVYWFRRDGANEITIIMDGSGQKPYAKISKETLEKLWENNIITKRNELLNYQGNKSYHFHDHRCTCAEE